MDNNLTTPHTDLGFRLLTGLVLYEKNEKILYNIFLMRTPEVAVYHGVPQSPVKSGRSGGRRVQSISYSCCML